VRQRDNQRFISKNDMIRILMRDRDSFEITEDQKEYIQGFIDRLITMEHHYLQRS